MKCPRCGKIHGFFGAGRDEATALPAWCNECLVAERIPVHGANYSCAECGDGMMRRDAPCGRCSKKTLRDEFAMAALTGLLSRNVFTDEHGFFAAQEAYRLADAMLAARNAK